MGGEGGTSLRISSKADVCTGWLAVQGQSTTSGTPSVGATAHKPLTLGLPAAQTKHPLTPRLCQGPSQVPCQPHVSDQPCIPTLPIKGQLFPFLPQMSTGIPYPEPWHCSHPKLRCPWPLAGPGKVHRQLQPHFTRSLVSGHTSLGTLVGRWGETLGFWATVT